MERKNIMIGAGISAVALTLLGLYFFLKSDDEKENSKDIETKEEILKQLEEEIKGLTKPNKENYVYDEKFILKVYYLLSKYATKLKNSITETSFQLKIKLLRNDDDLGYSKEFYRAEKEEVEELKGLTKKILSHLKIMEQDYIISLNHHSKNEEFLLKILIY